MLVEQDLDDGLRTWPVTPEGADPLGRRERLGRARANTPPARPVLAGNPRLSRLSSEAYVEPEIPPRIS